MGAFTQATLLSSSILVRSKDKIDRTNKIKSQAMTHTRYVETRRIADYSCVEASARSAFWAVREETFEVPARSIARQVRLAIDNADHQARSFVSYRVAAAARVTCPRAGSSREAGINYRETCVYIERGVHMTQRRN